MKEDFLNSFAETFEISTLLTELTDISEDISEDILNQSDERADSPPNSLPNSGVEELSVSELMNDIVNWRNIPDQVEIQGATQRKLDLDEISEMSLSKLFNEVNWRNDQLAEDVSVEVEQPFSVSNMFDDFNW